MQWSRWCPELGAPGQVGEEAGGAEVGPGLMGDVAGYRSWVHFSPLSTQMQLRTEPDGAGWCVVYSGPAACWEGGRRHGGEGWWAH